MNRTKTSQPNYLITQNVKQKQKKGLILLSFYFLTEIPTIQTIVPCSNAEYERIGPCLTCVYRVLGARWKFGAHERSVILTSRAQP